MGQIIATLVPLRFRLWLGRKLYAPPRNVSPFGVVQRVSRHRLIKGPTHPGEVEAMRYIAANTSIPIPKLYATHVGRDNLIYIEMEYVDGEDLDTVWRKGNLSPDQKVAIWADLKKYVTIMRELKPPSEDLVASAFENPAFDVRVGTRFFGPMSHREFHSMLRHNLMEEDIAMVLGEEVAKVNNTRYRTCFTHGDLVPRNIIVKDGRVAAIIDWGFSGWYPEYWEYTKGNYDYFPEEDWLEHFDKALPGYEDELIAEQSLCEKLLEPGTPACLSREGMTRVRAGSKPAADWLEARSRNKVKDLWSIALSSRLYSGDA